MKKVLLTLVSFLVVIFAPTASANIFERIGDSISDGWGNSAGFNESADNYLEGIGEDIVTDLFGNTGIGPIPDGEFVLPCPDEFNAIGANVSARQYILNVLNFALSFLGIVAVAALIYAGFLYVTDGGDGSNHEKSKKIILYAVVGILLILGSFAIVNTIIQNAPVGGNDATSSVAQPQPIDNSKSITEGCKSTGGPGNEFISVNGVAIPLSNRATIEFEDQENLWLRLGKTIVLGNTADNLAATFIINFDPTGQDPIVPAEMYYSFNGIGVPLSVNDITDNQKPVTLSYQEFDTGAQDLLVIIVDENNQKHLIRQKLFIGNGIEARFTASTFFPEGGEKVSLRGNNSFTTLGEINRHEWSTNCEGNVSGIKNRPEIQVEFFNDDDQNVLCEVTLMVKSTYFQEGNNFFGTFTEEFEIEPTDTAPEPVVNTVLIEQDPNTTGNDELFKVKVWADDKIDFPLEHFTYEVWESGNKLMSKTTTFGTDPSRGGSGGTQPADGFQQSYSELILDLSAYPGVRDLIFRVVARNSYGNEDEYDTVEEEYLIPEPLNVERRLLDFTLPVSIDLGNGYTPTLLPGDLLDPELYSFDWKVNGVFVSDEAQPDFTFTEGGMQTVTLTVSPLNSEEINFLPTYGWSVTKSVYVNTAATPDLPYDEITFDLPAQLDLDSEYAPEVSPTDKLDDDVYDYAWLIDGQAVSAEKAPTLTFTDKGLKTVTFSVSIKDGASPTFSPTNGWSVSKNIFIGEEDPTFPYKRVDFNVPPNAGVPSTIGVGEVINPIPIPEEYLEEDVYGFQWKLAGELVSEEKFPAITLDETGIQSLSLEVTLRPEATETFQAVDGWIVSKNIFVSKEKPADLEYKSIDFDLPTQLEIGKTYTPEEVRPADRLDDTIYSYDWLIDGVSVSEEKIPELLFEEKGLKTVTFVVSVQDERDPTFNPINGWAVSKKIFIGEDDPTNPYERLDFVVPDAVGLNQSINPIPLPEEALLEDVYDFQWEVNGKELATDKLPTLAFGTPGISQITLNVSTKPGLTSTFQAIEGWSVSRNVFVSSFENQPPVIWNISLTPGNTGNTSTVFSFYPLVSDPDGDALTYHWEFGDEVTMEVKNVAHRYQEPGEYEAVLSISDGLETVEETVQFTVVEVGQAIPPSTVEVYVRDEDSDLTADDIGIKNKEAYTSQLAEQKAERAVIAQELADLKDGQAALSEKLEDLNNPAERIQEALDSNPVLQEKLEELDTETDPIKREQMKQEISLLEDQIEAGVQAEIKEEKEALRIEIFQLNTKITEQEAELRAINIEIQELQKSLTGENFTIEGTENTTFFLYGELPLESARAVLMEWDLGDGRKKLGQSIFGKYATPGIYEVEMMVTDGINTVADSIKIKVNPARPGVSADSK